MCILSALSLQHHACRLYQLLQKISKLVFHWGKIRQACNLVHNIGILKLQDLDAAGQEGKFWTLRSLKPSRANCYLINWENSLNIARFCIAASFDFGQVVQILRQPWLLITSTWGIAVFLVGVFYRALSATQRQSRNDISYYLCTGLSAFRNTDK